MKRSARNRSYEISTYASRGRWRRNVAAFFGLWLILFNVVAAAALPSSALAGRAPFLDGALGDRIVICTGLGMVVVDHDGHPVKTPSGEPQPLCPFCLPLMQGALDAPAVQNCDVDASRIAGEAGLLVGATDVAVSHRLVASASPRGPPSA